MESDVSEKEAELPFLSVASSLEEDAEKDEVVDTPLPQKSCQNTSQNKISYLRNIEGLELNGNVSKLSKQIQEDQREQRKESRQNQEEDKDENHRIMEQLQEMQKEYKQGMQRIQEQYEENQERMQKLLQLSEDNQRDMKQKLTERDNDVNKMCDELQKLAAKLEESRNIGGQELPISDAELVQLRDSHEKLESKCKEMITNYETAMENNKAKIGKLQLKVRTLERTIKEAESRETENEFEKKKLQKKLNNVTQKLERQQNEMRQLLLWKDKAQMYFANAKRSQTDPDIKVKIVNNLAMKQNQGNATQYNITRKGNK